ncbi:ATP-binding cassette domain-containing protein [Bradyrhizobium sp. LTSPM299]|uniref:ATP-binding cassette domain-containing protein n=1 Tax=Bradyrhizobium sp. LTSPM299 TaxID=1619233 RepID=UPI0012E31EA7|nr:ATP-binding cassette domain-containing protein [Bradyrhizobium sp. LTSPM299]
MGSTWSHFRQRSSVRPVRSVIAINGAGKTSLIRTIPGIIRPSSGRIRWCGRDIAEMSPWELLQRLSNAIRDT